MTMAHAHLVDLSVTRWYHCVTRCVRRAFLLSEGPVNLQEWIELRLQELSEIFAIAVGGFSIMDNHLHVLERPDPRHRHGLIRLCPIEDRHEMDSSREGMLHPPGLIPE